MDASMKLIRLMFRPIIRLMAGNNGIEKYDAFNAWYDTATPEEKEKWRQEQEDKWTAEIARRRAEQEKP